MALIPKFEVTQEVLSQWYKLSEQLKALKLVEMTHRKNIFGALFPEPKEGVNNHKLDDGFVVKGTHPIDRKIDMGAYEALQEQFKEAGIVSDDLVKVELTLKKAEYNKLSKKQKLLFDQCLIIKPGSPSLSIVKPKK